jgi:hypothetical protein
MPNFLTRQDVDEYGYAVLDLSKRAALEAVSPMLDQLAAQNAKLQQQVSKEQRRRMDEQVEAAVPNFREIDRNPRWHRWLLGIDPLSSRPRQALLNDAINRGSASRAIEFFRQFLRTEADSTQSQTYSPTTQARSYGKPTYTRESIGQLYEMNRRGDYKGREDTWNRIESDIFAAQREGRVIDSPYLTK